MFWTSWRPRERPAKGRARVEGDDLDPIDLPRSVLDRNRLFLLGILALLLLGCQLSRDSGDPSGPPMEPIRLRILSYNIRHGLGMDGRIDLERAARVILKLDPDLVALQEVDNGTERSGGVDQARKLAELTGRKALFGEFMNFQGGLYGMALLTRLPVEGWQNHKLPDGPEPRSALAATVSLGGGERLVFVGVHLYATAEERYAQAQRLVEIHQDEWRPVILAGDFNSTPYSKVMDLLGGHWTIPGKGDAPLTFPAHAPDLEIDFILYRPAERFEVVESRVVDEPLASDHRPVLLELRLK